MATILDRETGQLTNVPAPRLAPNLMLPPPDAQQAPDQQGVAFYDLAAFLGLLSTVLGLLEE